MIKYKLRTFAEPPQAGEKWRFPNHPPSSQINEVALVAQNSEFNDCCLASAIAVSRWNHIVLLRQQPRLRLRLCVFYLVSLEARSSRHRSLRAGIQTTEPSTNRISNSERGNLVRERGLLSRFPSSVVIARRNKGKRGRAKGSQDGLNGTGPSPNRAAGSNAPIEMFITTANHSAEGRVVCTIYPLFGISFGSLNSARNESLW